MRIILIRPLVGALVDLLLVSVVRTTRIQCAMRPCRSRYVGEIGDDVQNPFHADTCYRC
jgi:hypothetical protein